MWPCSGLHVRWPAIFRSLRRKFKSFASSMRTLRCISGCFVRSVSIWRCRGGVWAIPLNMSHRALVSFASLRKTRRTDFAFVSETRPPLSEPFDWVSFRVYGIPAASATHFWCFGMKRTSFDEEHHNKSTLMLCGDLAKRNGI